jgi:hypothetical protein
MVVRGINVKVVTHAWKGEGEKKKKGVRTDPETWETIPPMEGKCDTEG